MFNFSQVKVPIGSTIEFSKDKSVKATVLDETHISLNNVKMSVSGATLKLLKQGGIQKKSVQGTLYWLYEGVSLAELSSRTKSQ
jgi:hypothetical protein